MPPPKKSHDGPNAILTWENDDAEGGSSQHVRLVTVWEPLARDYEAEGFARFEVRSQIGYIVWVGDPGVGELTLPWAEGSEPCQTYLLALLTHGFAEEQAEQEIKAVAGSLTQ